MSKTGNTAVKLTCNFYPTSSISPNCNTIFNKTGMKKRVFTDTLFFSNCYLALFFYLLVIPLLWPPNRPNVFFRSSTSPSSSFPA